VDILTPPSLDEKVAAARERLDAHVRETVAWHFDPQTGSPFWLDWAASRGIDPRLEVHGYADLELFGHFQDGWLRGGPVRRWIPRGLAGRPAYVFETGGSTGVPKSRVNIEDFQIDYERYSGELPDAGFPPGSDWLMLGPTGPRRLRLAVEHLAQHRGGICFHVDLDPRWVNKLVKDGRFRELEEYKAHVIEQGLTVLRAHEIRCLFTTPKLLSALCEKISLSKAGIRGIFCGGTEMNAQFNRFAREELVPGIEFVPTYGNTLMGLACPKPLDPSDNSPDKYAITYYPPAPRAVFDLVDPKDPRRQVAYGETGRVMLTTLTRDFFMPRFLERDEGERAEPTERYPWDGVSNLRLFSELQDSVVVGVY
jgi:phenylacetate-coenzyme A ligase PaaK-like adenylate-forming protein